MINLLFVSLLFSAELTLADSFLAEGSVGAASDSVTTEMIVRTNDFFWDSDWTYFSIDRNSYRVNTGDYGYYGPQPEYILDGIPVDPTLFGMNRPQALPIPFSQIAELQTLNGPGTINGYSYPSGVFHLRSYPLKEGLSVYASSQFGHNSQEPGPWIFESDEITPNIDRFGQWIDAGFSLKTGHWYSKAHIQRFSFINSNSFVQLRIRNLLGFPEEQVWPDGRSTTLSGLAETGIKTDRWHVRIQGVQSRSEDFIFFQPVGREIPTDLQAGQITLAADFYLNEQAGFRGMVQYREKYTGYRKNRLVEEFDWEQNRGVGQASFFLRREDFTLNVGSAFKNIETNASGLIEGNQPNLELFADQLMEISPRIRLGTYAGVTLLNDEVPLQLKADLQFDLSEKWNLEFEGYYSELLPDVANSVDDWFSGGYNLLDRLGIYNFVPVHLSKTKLFNLSHQHSIQFSERYEIRLGASYYHHLQLNLPFQDAYYNFEFSVRPGAYLILPEVHGRRLKLSLQTDLNGSERFQQSLGIYRTETLDGLPAYENYWKTIPKYIIRHTAVYKPYPDLEMRLNVGYQSKTIWNEYRRLDEALNRSFNVQFPFQLYQFQKKLNTGVLVNLTFAKWFWEQRLRVVFMLHNILNADQQSHPLAPKDKFGYFARIELRL